MTHVKSTFSTGGQWQKGLNQEKYILKGEYVSSIAITMYIPNKVTSTVAIIVEGMMTEDTGGSTRHPAHQCGNFGYDPPRKKYPNDGNPGITYFNDQVGINTIVKTEQVIVFVSKGLPKLNSLKLIPVLKCS